MGNFTRRDSTPVRLRPCVSLLDKWLRLTLVTLRLARSLGHGMKEMHTVLNFKMARRQTYGPQLILTPISVHPRIREQHSQQKKKKQIKKKQKKVIITGGSESTGSNNKHTVTKKSY